MKVKSIMNPEVATCRPTDSLYKAAQVMWDHDCGVVPVVNEKSGELAGVVTDRDLCMAAFLSNRRPELIPVRDVMAREVFSCTGDDDIKSVHATMRENQIRRLPVVDEGGRLTGLVSLNDLAVEAFRGRTGAAAKRQRDIARTIAAISEHRDDEEQI